TTEMKLPARRLRPVTYRPTFHKFAGQPVHGVQQHVTAARAYRPYRTAIAFMKAAHDQAPDKFAWRLRAYEFVDTIPAIDLLAGSAALREGIEAGAPLDDLVPSSGRFRDDVSGYLLYP